MSDSFINTFTVPKIASDATASAATFNAPLLYIERALNSLVQSTGARSANIQYSVSVAASVSAGDLVYFNATTAKYEKALAVLSQETGTAGQAIQAASSRVEGLILSVNTTQHSAVMLRSGYCSDPVIINTLGAGAAAGLYYLSPTTSGKATKLPGWDVRIPCISYYGNGKFSFAPFNSSYVGMGQAIIRNITTSNLNVVNNGYGQISINQKDYTGDQIAPSKYAITGIASDNQVSKSPIVSAILAGPGMRATYKGSGVWKLSLASLVGKPIPAADFTLNGTLRVSQGYLTYTVFPRQAKTYMTMLLTVPADVEATPISSVKVWMNTRGPGGCSYTAKLYWLPYSGIGSSTTIPTQFGTTTISSINTSTTTLCYYASDQVQTNITTQGVLVAEISTEGNPNDCYVHQAGFIFNTSQMISDSYSSDSDSNSVDRETIMAVLKEVLSYNPTYTE